MVGDEFLDSLVWALWGVKSGVLNSVCLWAFVYRHAVNPSMGAAGLKYLNALVAKYLDPLGCSLLGRLVWTGSRLVCRQILRWADRYRGFRLETSAVWH